MSTAVQPRTRVQRPVVEEMAYNPNSFPIEFQFGGEHYYLPAKDEHWVDSRTGETYAIPGVMPIRPKGSHFETKFEPIAAGGKAYTAFTAPISTKELMTYMLGDDEMSGRLGKAGVRLLAVNDDGINSAIRADAEKTAAEKKYADACATVSAFERANHKSISEGAPAKSPNANQRTAYKVKAQFESGEGVEGVQAMPFQCPQCYDRFAAQDGDRGLRAHIVSVHVTGTAELLAKAGLDAPEEKRGPGRPRKVDA